MAKKTYFELTNEIEKLQAQAAAIKDKERGDVIERIKHAISVYDITAADLGLVSTTGKRAPKAKAAKRGVRKAGRKAASVVKFRDEAGNTWGGRGPRPVWLREAIKGGATLESFAAKE